MARVLAHSFNRFHPDAAFFVLLLDEVEGCFDPLTEPYRIIGPEQLDIPNLKGLFFKYSILEASTAVKPYLLEYLFTRHDIHKLLYLDPDILVTRSLEPLSQLLDQHSIVLVPHLTSPYNDNREPAEVDILRAGVYNLGFIGVQNTAETTRLLKWWQNKVYHHCLVAVDRGMFVDQRWMDLAPGLFSGVEICRDPGYDVAYWNLHERRIKTHNGETLVNGQPLYFFHFSGLNPEDIYPVSKYQNRFTISDIGEARHLFEKYSDLVLQKGWRETKNWRYAYDYFSNGVRIPPEARRFYWELGEYANDLGDPFEWLEEKCSGAAPVHFHKSDPGFNVIGYLGSEKGVGEAMRAHLRSLEAAAVPHVVNHFVDTFSENPETSFSTSQDSPYPINLLMVNADQVPYFAQKNPGYLGGHYNIGGWNWELSTFPREWSNVFQFFHEIWAPSNFVRDSIASISPVPVTTMPYCINPAPEVSPGWTRAKLGLPEDKFIFLFFFDFLSCMERKNPMGLLRSFRRAFGGGREAMLLIKCVHSTPPRGLDPDFAAEMRVSYYQLVDAGRGVGFKLLEAVLPREGVTSLMSLCDCYVSLHRSEGFGLTMLEAMALGKPVIATAYSGNMDFMTPQNSFLVNYRLTEITRAWGPYKAGEIWADPDLEHAAHLMRKVFDEREAAAVVAQKGRHDILDNLHPEAVGRLMKERLHKVVQNALRTSARDPAQLFCDKS
jgi:glycosyltransferase involved in cell wall biosynthesis